MSLLFVDGFDHYATDHITKKWTAQLNGSINIVAGGRRGNCLRTSSNNQAHKLFPARSAVIMGCALLSPATWGGCSFITFANGLTPQVSVRRNWDGTLSLMRGSYNGTVLGTTAQPVVGDVWQYIECAFTIHSTLGTAELRVNGAPVLQLANVNTLQSSATVNGLMVGNDNNPINGWWYYDDLYLCDNQGSSANTFLGDCRVDTLYPSADGSYSAFAPSVGTDHATLVAGNVPSTTAYNAGGAGGDRDSYHFQDVPYTASQVVHGVAVNAALQKNDAGLRGAAPFARLNGVNQDGAANALSTDALIYQQPLSITPEGSVWTPARVNAAEFGVVVTS